MIFKFATNYTNFHELIFVHLADKKLVKIRVIRGKSKKQKSLHFLKSAGFLTNQIKTYF
ncbi:hypothetical protein BSF42_25000 [Flavobacterium sp. ACN6]|nr:hypothetical protein BSF42_25000 [Flavobacterium sp. ACN6]